MNQQFPKSDFSSEFFILNDVLSRRAIEKTDETAYRFLDESGNETASLSYAELEREAQEIAARLQSENAFGERVLLLFPAGLNFIKAFWGCLLAGAVAVPCYPPQTNRRFDKLKIIAEDAQAKFVLTTEQYLKKVQPIIRQDKSLVSLIWIDADNLEENLSDLWQKPTINGESLAFLQYTSGSTSVPKGVMVSHANLLHNQKMIRTAFRQDENSIIVGWLPLYHDMGLIGNVLQPLYVGGTCVLMSPLTFLQKPFRWLEAISRYRATTGGAPNFGFEHCIEKISDDEKSKLDLSSWKIAFNGAEPIKTETMRLFAEKFASCGFRTETFYPCYGLAEATLFVAGGECGEQTATMRVDERELQKNAVVESTENGRELTACGKVWGNQKIIIVDRANDEILQNGEIGEICISGNSVTKGYWNKSFETAKIFDFVPKDSNEKYLRTGDLGFISGGELFVTGRIKDLIIIRGRNYYPHDIEETVEKSHQALRKSGTAAFSFDLKGNESLIIVSEIEPRKTKNLDFTELFGKLNQEISETHELQAETILMVRAGSIPKTSSGKIRRFKCREMFADKKFETIGEWTRTDNRTIRLREDKTVDEKTFLIEKVAQLTKNAAANIKTDIPLTRYGLDSLGAVELSHALERYFEMKVSMSDILQGASIEQLLNNAKKSDESETKFSSRNLPITEIPLSQNQLSLYFFNQLNKQNTAYNVARAAKISGHFDLEKLRQVFTNLAARHQVLKSRFVEKDSQIVQTIDEAETVDFLVIDSQNPRELLQKEADHPFDLKKDSPFRIRIFRASESEVYLLIVFHHIVTDFHSLTILFNELREIYRTNGESDFNGQNSTSAGYSDFVAHQSSFLESKKGETARTYWLEKFAGELPVLNLPTDFSRPPKQTFAGEEILFELDKNLTEKLKHLAERFDSSLFSIILSGYFAFLSRYTNQTDIIVGTPTSGRTSAKFAETFGYFVNPLAIRADLAANPSFQNLHQQVKQTILSAFIHQDYPFSLLVKDLEIERNAATPPIFQTMFIWQNALPDNEKDELLNFALNRGGATLSLGELNFESVRLEQPSAQFDLSLSAAEIGEKICCAFQYNTDLLSGETVSKMAESFPLFIENLTKSPQKQISDVEILVTEEKTKILVDWNRTNFDFADAAKPLHRIIESQTEKTPHQTAVSFRNESLTFLELNQSANRLARFLIQKGVKCEDFVGVYLNRSLDLSVSLLAILKTGAAYIPLDPSYPKARTEYMLEDSAVKILLTSGDLRASLPPTNAEIISVNTEIAEIKKFSAENIELEIHPENSAYMIYTSGSTGKPKGAVNSHFAIVNRLLWMQKAYQIKETDTILQKTPYSFDVSVWEFFGSLMTGAKLFLAEPELHADSAYLVETIVRERITTLHFVPSVLKIFLEEANVGDCTSLKRVICSGEALPFDLTQKFFEKLPNAELHNLYGPTEAAVDVSFWHCLPDSKNKNVPIGKPISNVGLFILDKLLQPVAIGVAGELFIGGVAPARGYWKKVDLTAEKFIPNPFSKDGERLYRTGDLARFRHDGAIEYQGRIDNQVKINGVRIELGEIEAAIKQFSAVKDCVVITNGEKKRLIGYLAVRDESKIETMELRNFLSEILPRAVIPQQFVLLETIPLSPNGKVDRKALPEVSNKQASNNNFAAPQSELEEILSAVWKKVLGAESINVNDNFFTLGGDSIRSIQVRAKLREHGFDFELQELFRHQTVRALAKIVRPLTDEKVKNYFVLSEEDKNKLSANIAKAYPLTRLQTGLVFHQAHDEDYEIYVTSLIVSAKFDEKAMRKAVRFVTERHEILRTAFEMSEFSEPLQLVSETVEPNFKVEDLTNFTAEKQKEFLSQWLDIERTNSFDWAIAPLARFTVHHFSADSFQITLSEPVLDGWSVATLLSELLTVYAEFLYNKKLSEISVPPLFSDYVELELAALRSERQRSFWRENLRDFEGCSVVNYKVKTLSENKQTERIYVEIAPEISQKILDFANQSNLPLKSVLLAAHLRAVSILTAQTDVATALLYNGRPETANGERAVGLFLNAVPFRLNLDELNFTEIAQKAFSIETQLLPNRRFPLSEILRLHGKRAFFDTAFNYTHFHAYQSLHSIKDLKIKDIYASDQTYFPLTAQFNLDHENKTPNIRLALDYRPAQIGAPKVREFTDFLLEVLQKIGWENQPPQLFKTARANSAVEIEANNQDLSEWLKKIEQMSDEEARILKEQLLKNRM